MNTDDSEPAYEHFGKAGNYLWGNMAAYDILNVSMNEGDSIKDQDLTLCFAGTICLPTAGHLDPTLLLSIASGDLRNMIKTLNGIPLDYSGKCTLVINDFHPQVAIRNVLLLCMLLDPSGPSVELTAEAVLHTLYSASLTSAQSELVGKWIERASKFAQADPDIFHGAMNFTSSASVEWWYPRQVAILLRRIKAASYSKVQGETDRRRNMMNPQRIDYRERYYQSLRPRHRVGYTHWLDTGVLLPFGQPVDAFKKPNKFVFSFTCLGRRDATDRAIRFR